MFIKIACYQKFKIVVLVALTPVVVAVEVVRSHLPRVCDDPGIVWVLFMCCPCHLITLEGPSFVLLPLC